jgi:hypothetical protein
MMNFRGNRIIKRFRVGEEEKRGGLLKEVTSYCIA